MVLLELYIIILRAKNIPFRLSVIGQSFQDRPAIFEKAHISFRDYIDLWGYQQSREDYERVLMHADVIVSTANHEFFGIGILEAVAAGAYPLVPNRLSYPEILGLGRLEDSGRFFYDGTARELADKLSTLAGRIEKDTLWPASIGPATLTDHLKWRNIAHRYDKAFEEIRTGHAEGST